MCGRFVSSTPADQLASTFHAAWSDGPGRRPSWNVAPTVQVWTVVQDDDGRRLTTSRWGLVPPWAESPVVGARMINARAETLSERRAFRAAFRRRRCIVPADGFYEWQVVPGQRAKQPHYLHDPQGRVLAFAGLWERWRPRTGDGDGDEILSCTIVTRAATPQVATVHDRMPAILPDDAWDLWLDPGVTDDEVLTALLTERAAPELLLDRVSAEVNSTRHDGPQLVTPLGGSPTLGHGPGAR